MKLFQEHFVHICGVILGMWQCKRGLGSSVDENGGYFTEVKLVSHQDQNERVLAIVHLVSRVLTQLFSSSS